jgi:hypothetical protein
MVMLANQPPLLVYIRNPVSSFWLLVSSEQPAFARVPIETNNPQLETVPDCHSRPPISGEVGDELNTYNKVSRFQSFKVSKTQATFVADLETLRPLKP